MSRTISVKRLSREIGDPHEEMLAIFHALFTPSPFEADGSVGMIHRVSQR